MKILVTGAAGFIGSHLVDKLVELGHEVMVIDDLSNGKEENLNPKAHFLQEDISKDSFLDDSRNMFSPIGGTLLGIDYIFHLAAIPRVPYSIEHPTETHRVNVNGTFNILKIAKEYKVKKLIFASSSSVYGDQGLPLKETMIPQPISPYALHKQIGEQYLRMFNLVYGLPTLSLRFFNVYGKRADPESEYSLVIAKFKKLKAEGKPLTIYGDGEQTRDFTYVDDVVDACILAMEKPVQNKIINICNGKQTSINEIADLIGGKKAYCPPRKGDLLHTLGDNTKVKSLLGWQPKISVEEGIKLLEE